MSCVVRLIADRQPQDVQRRAAIAVKLQEQRIAEQVQILRSTGEHDAAR
ncbi:MULTISPECIES: hypothetical protein [unclassified Sphingomonas]|nr:MULTISPECIES: hypothetical protein [unclassified Sphingomonas]